MAGAFEPRRVLSASSESSGRALDYLIKPLQKDDPVSLSCCAIHTCFPTPPGATQCRHCSDVVWAVFGHMYSQPYAMIPYVPCSIMQGLLPHDELRIEALSHQGLRCAAAATCGTSGERAD